MPVVTKDQAVAILTEEVEHNSDISDVLDVDNELFPDTQLTEQTVGTNRDRLVRPIVELLRSDREAEELVDFWRLIQPKHGTSGTTKKRIGSTTTKSRNRSPPNRTPAVPATALNHFQQDIARACAIVALADPLPTGTGDERLLRGDLFRSGWMFAVGALDAYFCDAYTDIVAAPIISKGRHDPLNLPEFLRIKFPVRAILESYAVNTNWRWRMAARRMMERENVLSLETIRKLFNKFFRPGQKLFGDVMRTLVTHPDANRWLFGITAARFNGLAAGAQNAAVKTAQDALEDRFWIIFQRRHDSIHNCDRPRVSPQPLAVARAVTQVIDDIEFLVRRCNEHIDAEFRPFLLGCGCPAAIVTQVGYWPSGPCFLSAECGFAQRRRRWRR